jgi:uncharacterized damage-inducible protein DinB
MISHIQSLLLRDLASLQKEIASYQDDASLWVTLPGTLNSGGNLALHLAGNLRHFIGALIGNSGYVRERDLEFSTKNLSRVQVNEILDACAKEVSLALSKCDDSILKTDFPAEIKGTDRTTGAVLMHLMGHLNYHLGQINYHRRIVGQKQQ